MKVLTAIGLGSNLGDRRATLEAAIAAIREVDGLEAVDVSRFLETAPVGGPAGQGPFLNAAVVAQASMDPLELLDRLHAIETALGRKRRVRWDERTLDLDLLLWGQTVIQTHELILPHPRMAVRRFVLAPLAQIAPMVTHPMTGLTVAELLGRLDRRAVGLFGWPPEQLADLAAAVPDAWHVVAGGTPTPDLADTLTFAAVPAAAWASEELRPLPRCVPRLILDHASDAVCAELAAACAAAL